MITVLLIGMIAFLWVCALAQQIQIRNLHRELSELSDRADQMAYWLKKNIEEDRLEEILQFEANNFDYSLEVGSDDGDQDDLVDILNVRDIRELRR